MPVSKVDMARVLLGEKRHRSFKEQCALPAKKRKASDRLSTVRKAPDIEPEQVDSEAARLSGGVTDSVPMRNADAKFVRNQREFSGQIWQGTVHVSKIDGHVYGSRQKIGRTLEECAKDDGWDHPDKIIGGLGKEYVAKKHATPSPNKSAFKKRWKDSAFVVEKRG